MKIEWDLKGFSNGSQFSMECSSFGSFDRWPHYNISVNISILKGISPNFQNRTRLYSKGKTMFSMIQNETSTGSCSCKEDKHFL